MKNNCRYEEIYNALMRFQMCVRHFSHAQPLTVSENQILGEIYSFSDATHHDIATRLYFKKSTFSRAMTKLSTKGFLLTPVQASEDARRKSPRLSREGRKVLQDDDTLRSKTSEKLLSPLNSSQKKKIEMLFKKLADGFQITDSPRRLNEHPLRPHQRRLSRAFGLLHETKKALIMSEIHIVYVLSLHPSGILQKHLTEHVPYTAASVSRLLLGLKRKGFVNVSFLSRDVKNKVISLTGAGFSALKRHTEKGGRKIAEATANWSQADLRAMADLLIAMSNSKGNDNKLSLSLRLITNKAGLYQLREFAFKQLYKSGEYKHLSGSFFPDENINFFIDAFDGPAAALSLAKSNKNRYSLEEVIFRYGSDPVSSQNIKSLLQNYFGMNYGITF